MRRSARLGTLFGALALTLAAVGLFGLMSYNVSRRTNEIGIRMALGADRRRLAGMVLGESLLLVGLGTAVGLVVALASTRFVSAILFGMAPTDLVTFLAAVGVLGTVATLAAFLPARRASRVDPMQALRQQ